MNSIFVCLAATALHLASALAGETIIKDLQGMDCYVYLPDPIVPETTYQLVVGVHGVGGKGSGAAGLKDWVKRGLSTQKPPRVVWAIQKRDR